MTIESHHGVEMVGNALGNQSRLAEDVPIDDPPFLVQLDGREDAVVPLVADEEVKQRIAGCPIETFEGPRPVPRAGAIQHL